MSTVLRTLIGLGWGSLALFVAFIFGCTVGALAWRKFHPRWPLEYDDLANLIIGLNAELRKVDKAVNVLWVTAKKGQQRVPPTNAFTGSASDPKSAKINQLVVETITIKHRLQHFIQELEIVTAWLTAAKIEQKPGPTTRQGVVIERKEPDDPIAPGGSSSLEEPQYASTQALIEGNPGVGHEPGSPPPFSRSQSRGGTYPSKVIDLYNRALTDQRASQEFREQYQPIRIGIVNAVERRLNPTAPIEPEFRQTTDGDFFAFPLSEPNRYGVVPRLGLTIGPVSYQAGALGEVFGNPRYDPAQSYSRYQVREPALFKCDGEKWELASPGRLDLGTPD